MVSKPRFLRKRQPEDATDVVIAGGGVAALEAALALHSLAGDSVRLTLLTPAEDFIYQPVAVLEPYERRTARRLSLADFATEIGATLVQDTLVSVDTSSRRLVTGTGRELGYDALLVAIGATARTPLEGAVLLHPARPDARLNNLIQEVDAGSVHSLALIAPSPGWPLPIYEFALLARERADNNGRALDLTIVAAERRPLEQFGPKISEAAADLLASADIKVLADSTVEPSADSLVVQPDGTELKVDRVVALPRLEGPRIDGLPCDSDGFLLVTASCAVAGVEGVYAAGDATQFPVKFGGIAALQADTAAESIAALAGSSIVPTPFDGVVHGILLSGRNRRLYFSARMDNDSSRESEMSEQPTSPTDAKIAARFLGPYLDDRWASSPRWIAGQLALERTVSKLQRDAENSI